MGIVIGIVLGILGTSPFFLPSPVWAQPALPSFCATFEAPDFPKSSLEVITQPATYTLEVELAPSPFLRRMGLMCRTSLEENKGMLFVFPSSQKRVGMWMKNTLIPLDMLFLDKRGFIVEIAENATPLSQDVLPSEEGLNGIRGVLELPAGSVKKLGIVKTQRVKHPAFQLIK